MLQETLPLSILPAFTLLLGRNLESRELVFCGIRRRLAFLRAHLAFLSSSAVSRGMEVLAQLRDLYTQGKGLEVFWALFLKNVGIRLRAPPFPLELHRGDTFHVSS